MVTTNLDRDLQILRARCAAETSADPAAPGPAAERPAAGTETRWVADDFFVCAGSVTGREHVRLGRNNQDGVAVSVEAGVLAAAVADGCSSSRASEVGARLAVDWLVTRGAYLLRSCRGCSSDERAAVITDGLVEFLARIAVDLSGGGERLRRVVNDCLLFTFLSAYVTDEEALVFGVGDGVFSVDGRVTCLSSGSENTPRYVSYRLVGTSQLTTDPGSLDPVVHYVGPRDVLRSLVIATDGAVDLEAHRGSPMNGGRVRDGLEELANDPGYLANPSLLEKRLRVIGALQGRLFDDTSVAVVRRRPAGSSPRGIFASRAGEAR